LSNSNPVLDSGSWQVQGNPTSSQGAGLGGAVFTTGTGPGMDGRVEVAW